MKRIMVLWITFWSGTVYAGAFQDAQNFAAGHPASNVVQGATVTGNNVPGYTTANPTQTTLNNPTALNGSSAGAIANDSTGAGSFIQNSAVSRPQFTINGNSPLVKGAQSIQANAGALSGITPSNTSGCQSVQVSSPAQYDTYTCTQSNTIVSPVCNQSLSVTATSTPSCTTGSSLGTASVNSIAGPNTWSKGTMKITAQCGLAPGYTNIYMHLTNAGGDCDNFKNYRNLGHLNLQITPQTAVGVEQPIGDIYMVKWKGYFYCINPAKVYATFKGCTNNQCTLNFRVNDGTPPTLTCSNGSKVQTTRRKNGLKVTYQHYCFCNRFMKTCPTLIKTYTYLKKTLKWTQNHSITTFTDTWNNLLCQ